MKGGDRLRRGLRDLCCVSEGPTDLRGVGGDIISRIASKTTRNCASYFFSSAASFLASPEFDWSICRRRTNARMISMLTCTALGLRRTLDSIATPCSVKAWGW